jgi:hypothetical protein
MPCLLCFVECMPLYTMGWPADCVAGLCKGSGIASRLRLWCTRVATRCERPHRKACLLLLCTVGVLWHCMPLLSHRFGVLDDWRCYALLYDGGLVVFSRACLTWLLTDGRPAGAVGDCLYVLVSLALSARRQLCQGVHKVFLHRQVQCVRYVDAT